MSCSIADEVDLAPGHRLLGAARAFRSTTFYVVVPADGSSVKRLDLRLLFGKREIESRVIYVRDPESFWIGSRNGRAEDFINLPVADVLERAKTL